MIDTKLHWLIIAIVGLGVALAVKDTFANPYDDCPVNSYFAGQAQHDCTAYLALKAHGGTSDLDSLEKSCSGPVCTYRERPKTGAVEYSTPYGSWVVVYPKPYYGD